MKCIVCGKENEPKESAEYKFLHGSISVCYSCRPILMYKIEGGNVPIGWVHPEDLYIEGVREIIPKKEAEELTMKDMFSIAKHMEEQFQESYESLYEHLMKHSIPYWKQEKEEELVRNTPPKELPILIGSLKFEKNKQLLEQRLKGEDNND